MRKPDARELSIADALLQPLNPLLSIKAVVLVIVHEVETSNERLPKPPCRDMPTPDVAADLDAVAARVVVHILADAPFFLRSFNVAPENRADICRRPVALVLLPEQFLRHRCAFLGNRLICEHTRIAPRLRICVPVRALLGVQPKRMSVVIATRRADDQLRAVVHR